jgi:hypothetical protein
MKEWKFEQQSFGNQQPTTKKDERMKVCTRKFLSRTTTKWMKE